MKGRSGNWGEGLNIDQSTYPQYRTPSRPGDRTYWYSVRDQILVFWSQGLTASQMAVRIKTQGHKNQYRNGEVSAQTVRSWFQRIYNEFGIRSPAGALYTAIQQGLIPCPCPHCSSKTTKTTTQEKN